MVELLPKILLIPIITHLNFDTPHLNFDTPLQFSFFFTIGEMMLERAKNLAC